MRIAISVENNNGFESTVAVHFGRCPYFALVDMEGDEVQAIEVVANPHFASHEPGQIPGYIHEQKVDVMLSGGMGGRAIRFFEQYGIKTATGAWGTVRDTLERYTGGELREAAPCAESVAHGHG